MQHPAATQRIGITAVGSHLPARRLTSQQLQDEITAGTRLALPERMLEKATGIRTRRFAADGEYASTLATGAARRALAARGLDPRDIDLLLFASATRDICEPATAHIVQTELGTRAHALDVSNACNSFLNGIDLARAMILAGRARRALVVTGETPSRAMRRDPADAAALRDGFAGYTFGDAGAAVVVEPVERGGILDTATVTASEHWQAGGIPGGGSRHPRGDEYSYFRGGGKELRGIFERIGPAALADLTQRTGLTWDDYARVLVHQVTVPYLERFVELTGAPADRLVLTVPELGNVASATIGIQLDLVKAQLKPGEKVLMIGLGGGVSLMTMVWEAS
ncbi:3-oxoacyl-ACP synthase III family protein [Kitasatospora aureofaciens]|uniref:3-oxoacyl-ACP synthase n=1 Tax=Kitasatospora aureofaciens TaxID=1894 RepID=A0A1E7MVL3_KITAU|nr:ketoacyl-ACP synthase III [Kitasatospora aureofaciens]OEV32472.1 3-oxoacyl-ACP synthase [Kitasatospora aureofaciens]QEU97990.1 ketoacyl-ACP synthase III [Streptomyces viridifaciens]UKZ10658.1 ketoacyl-ACP synthase III [Streptomyces viridifaciens]GGU68750.1 3-oxoacyl-ACP synthase [Kitasatospora aureofaciens]